MLYKLCDVCHVAMKWHKDCWTFLMIWPWIQRFALRLSSPWCDVPVRTSSRKLLIFLILRRTTKLAHLFGLIWLTLLNQLNQCMEFREYIIVIVISFLYFIRIWMNINLVEGRNKAIICYITYIVQVKPSQVSRSDHTSNYYQCLV